MKVSLSFEELSKVLNFSSVILSDKIVEEKLKNVIFIVSKESVQVSFYNALTFCRSEIENVKSIEDVDDSGWIFQVKYNELNKIISGFTSLYKTHVEEISFEDNMSKINVKVSEKSNKEEDSRLNQTSVFILDSVPLIESIKKDILLEFPDGSDLVSGNDVLLYVDSMLPIMSNDTGNSLGNKLNMAEDYVFILTSSMSVFFKNKLPEAFKGITIGYSSVNFLKKLSLLGDLLVKRTEKFLCVSVGNTEAFMRYQGIKIRHEQYVKRFKKDNGILLNRLYFKDVLKRMNNVASDGKCTILENGDLSVENPNFSQIVPVEKSKGTVSGVSFKVSIPTIDKLIIGNDSAFPEEVFMYLDKSGSGYSLFFSDKTGAWFSMTQVR